MLRDLLVDAADSTLEATIAGSFSKLGYLARRGLSGWHPPPRLDGRVLLVTGASSGIGRAASVELARLGADLWLVGRDERRLAAAVAAALEAGAEAGGRIEGALADLTDERQVCALAARVAGAGARLDGLVHNAGVMVPRYRTATDGTEMTVATHVLAPFRLSCRLLPLLSWRSPRSSSPFPPVACTPSGAMSPAWRWGLTTIEEPSLTPGPSGRRWCWQRNGPGGGAVTAWLATPCILAGSTRPV